jgi:hypothetical protein
MWMFGNSGLIFFFLGFWGKWRRLVFFGFEKKEQNGDTWWTTIFGNFDGDAWYK